MDLTKPQKLIADPQEKDLIYTEDKLILTKFYKIWTEKEASGKLDGRGIAPAIQKCRMLPCTNDVLLEQFQKSYYTSNDHHGKRGKTRPTA